MIPGALRKLAAMRRDEARFRLGCALRTWRGRLLTAVGRPRWKRDHLAAVIRRDIDGAAAWTEGHRAAEAGDYRAAHRAFAHHFATRRSAFPINACDLGELADAVRRSCPAAADDARQRAEALLRGRYDLLGHRGVEFGSPPDWHADPVHGLRSPEQYWSTVPYLDPQCGDHKLIWELNRHQHWLTLGRAHALTGDLRYYREFVAQLESWLAANPPLWGTNWASMLEIAFRSLSWLWSLELFAGTADGDVSPGPPWTVDLLLGLDRQLVHVQQNLSHYFSPNTHLSGEALALYVAGLALPELRASRDRADAGRAVLIREAARQIRSDGGHAELSAHYHRYSADFYLLALAVARRADDPAAEIFEEAALRQSEFLRTIADDRGRRPLIGDDDGGQLFPLCGRGAEDCSDTLAIAATLLNRPALAVGAAAEEAYWFCGPAAGQSQPAAADTAWPSAELPASGYYVLRSPGGDQLILDAGPHGYLNGGHAHADALGIVLNVGGQPLLIDPGTATYTMDVEMRDRFRSTAMHNTLVLDGRSQSEPAGPFHWRTTAEAHAPIWRTSPACDYAEGTHDGYAPRRHTRGVLAIHGVGWWIIDHVLGAGTAEIVLHWHLHPAVRVLRASGATAALERDGRPLAIAVSIPVSLLAPGSDPLAVWAPVYGRTEPAPVLRSRTSAVLPASVATFIPAVAPLARNLTVESLPVALSPGKDWQAAAFRARWDGGEMILAAAVERSGCPADASAAPARRWGPADLTTDARVAVMIDDGRGDVQGLIVNGSSLERRGNVPLLTLPHTVPVVRQPAGAPLASTVHAPAGAR